PRVRPLPACYLYWCRSHFGLAILQRGYQADNCDEGPGAWLVARDEADDRELAPAAWLDEAVGQSRNHYCSVVRVGAAASRNSCATSARERRAENAHRPLRRPGAGAADDAESRSAAGNRRATRRWSRPDGA